MLSAFETARIYGPTEGPIGILNSRATSASYSPCQDLPLRGVQEGLIRSGAQTNWSSVGEAAAVVFENAMSLRIS